MFDDLFCATALATVGAVLAAGVWLGASEIAMSTPLPTVMSKAEAPRVKAGTGVAKEAMPVYDLPRVVVAGSRSRDGDMLAVDMPADAGESARR
ncbi:MAG: hypothetical protein ABI564_09120 [Ideonella sp.]